MDEQWITVPSAALARGHRPHEVHTALWSGGDGLTGVAIHGLGGSHLNWSLLAPLLAGMDGIGEVWAPDLAGFGLTEPGERGSTVGANIDLALGFLNTVSPEQPVLLLGNSMGGLISLKLAARNPEAVAALVLIDPACPPRLIGPMDPQVVARFAGFMVPGLGDRWMRRRQSRTTPEQQVAEIMRLVTAAPDDLDPAALERHVAIASRRREMPHAIGSFMTAARSLMRHLIIGRRRYWALVDAMDTPTLLIHGAADRLVQDHTTELLVEHRPDWGFSSYEDLGHVPMLEAPARVAEDIGTWLNEVDLLPTPAG